MEHLAHGRHHVLEGPGVGQGDEGEDQVGMGAQRLEELAARLAGGEGGDGMLGEGGGEGHRQLGDGRRVRGTTTVSPLLVRQWASMVPGAG